MTTGLLHTLQAPALTCPMPTVATVGMCTHMRTTLLYTLQAPVLSCPRLPLHLQAPALTWPMPPSALRRQLHPYAQCPLKASAGAFTHMQSATLASACHMPTTIWLVNAPELICTLPAATPQASARTCPPHFYGFHCHIYSYAHCPRPLQHLHSYSLCIPLASAGTGTHTLNLVLPHVLFRHLHSHAHSSPLASAGSCTLVSTAPCWTQQVSAIICSLYHWASAGT